MKRFIVMQHPVDMQGFYSDAYIDYWGEIYLANPIIRERGVLFGTFLMFPAEILHAIVMQSIEVDLAPGLLAQQRAVQRRIDEALRGGQLSLALDAVIVALEHKGARVSDGAWIEPLRHHRYPRRYDRQDHVAKEA